MKNLLFGLWIFNVVWNALFFALHGLGVMSGGFFTYFHAAMLGFSIVGLVWHVKDRREIRERAR